MNRIVIFWFSQDFLSEAGNLFGPYARHALWGNTMFHFAQQPFKDYGKSFIPLAFVFDKNPYLLFYVYFGIHSSSSPH